jgi:hypothetical protein
VLTPHHVNCQIGFEDQCAQDGANIFHGLLGGERAFYVSSTNCQGEENYLHNYVDIWSSFWKEKNVEFKKFLVKDLHFCWLS